jgi:hypothetical protein
MIEGFHDLRISVNNGQSSVDSLNESMDTFQRVNEAHETRINQHDHGIAEMRNQQRSQHDQLAETSPTTDSASSEARKRGLGEDPPGNTITGFVREAQLEEL